MINVNFKVSEYLTSVPLSATEITVRVIVAPLFTDKIPVEQGNEIQPASTNDKNEDPTKVVVVTRPDLTRAVFSNSQTVLTNAQGNARFEFDVSKEFDQVLRQPGVSESQVNAYLEVRVRVANYGNISSYWDRPLLRDSTIDEKLRIDFAKCMVGHTTRKQVKLWFCLHGTKDSNDKIVCLLRPFSSQANSIIAAKEVDIEEDARTGIVRFTDLEAGTAYRFEFRYQSPNEQNNPQRGIFLTGGQFSTLPDGEDVIRLAFASCHRPTGDPGVNVMDRWEQLRNTATTQFDSLLLLGDQIYGDNIEVFWSDETWFGRYKNRYHQLWGYRPIRELFSSVPTYMMLDDHEVVDDYGVVDLCEERDTDDCEDRVAAALKTYKLFQHAHNPANRSQPPFSFSFRNGPAEIFVSDNRTRRSPGRKGDHPVLGDEQFLQLQQWAASPAVENAEVVIFTTSVPLAVFPFSELRKLVEQVAVVGGATFGGLVGGPGGLVLGGLAGYFYGGQAVEVVEDRFKNSLDLEDQWIFRENQKDLVAVLDILFDLANGINPKTGIANGKHKIVLALSGDSHMGMLHLLRSLKDKHRQNPYIYSMTSSPISYPPASESKLKLILAAIRAEHGLDSVKGALRDVTLGNIAGLGGNNKIKKSIEDNNPWIFFLDDHQSLKDQGKEVNQYVAEIIDVIPERNYGLVNIRKLPEPLTTLYNVRLSINGTKSTLQFKNKGFEVNLGADRIRPEEIGTFNLKKGLPPKDDDPPTLTTTGRK